MPKKDLHDRIKAKEAASTEGPRNPIEPKLEAAADEGSANERNGPSLKSKRMTKAMKPKLSPHAAIPIGRA